MLHAKINNTFINYDTFHNSWPCFQVNVYTRENSKELRNGLMGKKLWMSIENLVIRCQNLDFSSDPGPGLLKESGYELLLLDWSHVSTSCACTLTLVSFKGYLPIHLLHRLAVRNKDQSNTSNTTHLFRREL